MFYSCSKQVPRQFSFCWKQAAVEYQLEQLCSQKGLSIDDNKILFKTLAGVLRLSLHALKTPVQISSIFINLVVPSSHPSFIFMKLKSAKSALPCPCFCTCEGLVKFKWLRQKSKTAFGVISTRSEFNFKINALLLQQPKLFAFLEMAKAQLVIKKNTDYWQVKSRFRSLIQHFFDLCTPDYEAWKTGLESAVVRVP